MAQPYNMVKSIIMTYLYVHSLQYFPYHFVILASYVASANMAIISCICETKV